MNRILKKFLSLGLVLLLCLTLCSCSHLDELRNARAVQNEDGSVTFHGVTYIEAENSIRQSLSGSAFLRIYESSAYLVSEDVPALLTDIMGIEFGYNENETLLFIDNDCYVREDYLPALTELLANPVYDHYCCYAYDTAVSGYHYQLLNSGWSELLDTLAGLALSARTSGNSIDNMTDVGFFWSEYIYPCDSEMICCKVPFAILETFDYNESVYYTEDEAESAYYVIDDSTGSVAEIPAEYYNSLRTFLDEYSLL